MPIRRELNYLGGERVRKLRTNAEKKASKRRGKRDIFFPLEGAFQNVTAFVSGKKEYEKGKGK